MMCTKDKQGPRKDTCWSLTIEHWSDWLAIIVVALTGGLLTLVQPAARIYFPNDPSIQFPHQVGTL
jgi:hypothetical protein